MPRTKKEVSGESNRKSSAKQDSVKRGEVDSSVRRASASKKRYVDTEEWVEKHLSELVDALGLRFLELTDEEYLKIVAGIVDMVRGEASTLNLDTIVKRFRRNTVLLYPIIAATILELRDALTDSQIEFVVNNIGEAVLTYASRLYRELVAKGRNDLIDRLREYWNRYWVVKRHPVLPVSCPVCKFNALMPDLTCMVCSSTVSEKTLKDHANFTELLKDFVKNYGVEDVMKAISYGYVYLSSIGLKPPTDARDPLDIEIVLSSREREFIKSLIEVRSSKW